MEWAISGLAVSLDEAAKFICQGIFEKNCGGDSAPVSYTHLRAHET